MTVVPADIPTGLVTGQFFFVNEDSVDADTDPDLTVVQGAVIFECSAKRLRMPTKLATVVPLEFKGKFNSQGQLVSAEDTRVGLKLPATDSPLFNPTDFTWKVIFDLVQVENRHTITIDSFDIQVPEGQTTDLTTVMPVSTAPGVLTVQGPQGVEGPAGPQGVSNIAMDEEGLYYAPGAGDSADVVDGHVVELLSNPESATSTALSATYASKTARPNFTGGIRSNLDGISVFGVNAKPLEDKSAGVLDWGHNSDVGYLLHLVAGTTPGGGLIGLGTDHPGKTGLVVSNKANGAGSVGIGVQNTSTSTGTGFDGGNFGTGKLMNLAKGNINAGTLLTLKGFLASTTGILTWRNANDTVDLGKIEDDGTLNVYGINQGRVKFGMGDSLDQRIYTYTGTPGQFWTSAIKGTTNSLLFQTGQSAAHAQGAETLTTLIEIKAGSRLGFFGAAPVVKPAALPADATDLATALALLNYLKNSVVKPLGLAA